MSKRRAKMHTEIDSDSDYAPEEGGQRRLAPRTKRKRTTATESNVVELRGTFGRAVRHATSLHTITNPKPLQSALLAWYDTVHEQRGMPWRKPFVSTSDRKVRSQRAYEVSELKYTIMSLCHDVQGFRYGYRRSCFSKLKSRQ